MEPQKLVCERCDSFSLCFRYAGEWICSDCETIEDEFLYMLENKTRSKLPPLELEYEEEDEG